MNKIDSVRDKDSNNLPEPLISPSLLLNPLLSDKEESLSPLIPNDPDDQNNDTMNLNLSGDNDNSDKNNDLYQNDGRFYHINCLIQFGVCFILWGSNNFGDYLVLTSSLYLTTISTVQDLNNQNTWGTFIILFTVSTMCRWMQQITSLDENNHDMYSNNVSAIMVTAACCFLICQHGYSSLFCRNRPHINRILKRIESSSLSSDHWRILAFPIHFTAAMNLANYIFAIYEYVNNSSTNMGMFNEWFLTDSNIFDHWTNFFGNFSGTSFISAWTIKLSFHLIQALFSWKLSNENVIKNEEGLCRQKQDKIQEANDDSVLHYHFHDNDKDYYCKEHSSNLLSQSSPSDNHDMHTIRTNGIKSENKNILRKLSKKSLTSVLLESNNNDKIGGNEYNDFTEEDTGNSIRDHQKSKVIFSTAATRVAKHTAFYLFINLILFLFSIANRNYSRHNGQKVNVVCFDMDTESYTNQEQLNILKEYSSSFKSTDDLWLCSEKAFFVISNTEEKKLLNDITSIAQSSNKTVGYGYYRQIDISDHPGIYDFKNMFTLVNPKGEIIWNYQNVITTGSYTSEKAHKLQPGTTIAYPKSIDLNSINTNSFLLHLGLGIGHDYDDASLIRESSRHQNTNLMIQIGSNNHRNILARSIENGFNILSCSHDEGATLYNPAGTITQFQPQSLNKKSSISSTKDKFFRAEVLVPKKRIFTFYSFCGNSLGFICLFLSALQLILLKGFNNLEE